MKKYLLAVCCMAVPLLAGCGQKAYTRGPAVTPAPVVQGTLKPSSSSLHVTASPGDLHCGYTPPVWVNTHTHLFHRKGDVFYGKTKHGGYACQKDALAAGYRLANEPVTQKKSR